MTKRTPKDKLPPNARAERDCYGDLADQVDEAMKEMEDEE